MHSLSTALAYDKSPNFLSAESSGAWGAHPFAHLCRVLQKDFAFEGVYTLQGGERQSPTPVVAVVGARDEEEAREIHRLVWNQDFVPFILVQSPRTIRLYSGFAWEKNEDRTNLIKPLTDFSRIHEALKGLHAHEIDDGTVWSIWGKHQKKHQRLDSHLLGNLKGLAIQLQRIGLDATTAHALIGRYVYLLYLRDRGFLSERKLKKWDLELDQVFGRQAKLEAFHLLNDKLDDATEGLNGAIFPFSRDLIQQKHLTLLACAFIGDDPEGGQMALDLGMYNFSYIPVETLSVIYEQFLHEPTGQGGLSKGREGGAYYTPINLVNYMLAEMDAQSPLGPGVKVLDPSCGSGAFLVQTYRILIERAIRESGQNSLPPRKLRDILEQQIFGVDRDTDACRIAEMSLLVTLLDYVDPPDLEGKYHNFHLPKLSGKNLFQSDFFATDGPWANFMEQQNGQEGFDWVVGNPPWKEIKNPPKDPQDRAAIEWMKRKEAPPTGGNQLAEAFVWKSREVLKPGGRATFVLPAMTLFKSESKAFRKALFTNVEVESVVNLANLCYVLFARRAAVPAMTLRFREPESSGESKKQSIQSFAPFVINQEANRPQKSNSQLDTWTITVNASEIQEIDYEEAAEGKALTWKMAMWGNRHDCRLLEKLEKRFNTLGKWATENNIQLSQGLELRDPKNSSENLDPVPEVENQTELLFEKLKNCGRIVHFPKTALATVSKDRGWVRKGRGKFPLLVSRPPHLIVDASRRFAVFSDQFIVVPPRKIGIGGNEKDSVNLIRSLAVLLNSDYFRYHQFFQSNEWGIQKSISTLQTLKDLPVPDLGKTAEKWAQWHREMESRYEPGEVLREEDQVEINKMVFDALELRPEERLLIQDFVRFNLLQVQGKVEKEAVRPPELEEMRNYLRVLRDQLDDFMADESAPAANQLTALFNERSVMIEVVLREGKTPIEPILLNASSEEAKALNRASEQIIDRRRQWLYFQRNLRIYSGGKLFLLKPRQRIHWSQRQAILDADELIAEALRAQTKGDFITQ